MKANDNGAFGRIVQIGRKVEAARALPPCIWCGRNDVPRYTWHSRDRRARDGWTPPLTLCKACAREFEGFGLERTDKGSAH